MKQHSRYTAGVKVPCCTLTVMQAVSPELQKVTTPYKCRVMLKTKTLEF